MIFVKDESADVPDVLQARIWQKWRKYRRFGGVRFILVRHTTATINKDGVIEAHNLTAMIENKYKKLKK